MRSYLAAGSGLRLARARSHRQEILRRRLAVIMAFLALAVGGALVGRVTAPSDAPGAGIRTGPFSYFPYD